MALCGISPRDRIPEPPIPERHRGPPVVLDTNVLVAGACRRESSLAHQLLMGALDGRYPIILTPPIVLEYLDVMGRPSIRKLTGLSRRQGEDLVDELIALSRRVQLRFSWRFNLRDGRDDKFVDAAVHASAVIVTYNVRDFESPELGRHGWTAMTPRQFLALYS